MGQIKDISNPWRKQLLAAPASFRGVIFHVENGSRMSGRRTVLHEYPKRNDGYAEDMGRHARRFSFSGYLIYRPSNPLYQYTVQRVRLINALEDDDAGILIHPVFTTTSGLKVMCERYSMMESRERGGYSQFEMQFVELGSPGNSKTQIDASGNVAREAKKTEDVAVASLDNNAAAAFELGEQQRGG